MKSSDTMYMQQINQLTHVSQRDGWEEGEERKRERERERGVISRGIVISCHLV